jgi:hypothetical protein
MAEVFDSSPGARANIIIARASRDYRWRRYLLVIVLFGYGLYSYYDGFYRYPAENTAFLKLNPGAEKLPHPALDIPFNQTFGIALPPISLLFLVWVFYVSRGEYRFDGTAIQAPGHVSVSIKAIRKIDRDKWDRKGIAYLHYQVPGSAKLGILKLDDFIYDRRPTDAIFEQVVLATETNKPAAAPAPGNSSVG